MRTLIWIIHLTWSFSLIADSIDMRNIVYDGTQNSTDLILKAEKSQIGTRAENRETICYRQELSGYRTICAGGYLPGELPPPSLNPQRPPRCWAEPVFASVPFSCVQPFNVPYIIKEYDVEARVTLNFKNSSPQVLTREVFKLTLKGENLSLGVEASKKFLITKKEEISISRSGALKTIEAQVDIEFIEAAPLLKSYQLSDLHMDHNKLFFNLKENVPKKFLAFALSVSRLKGSQVESVMLSRSLSLKEVEFKEEDSQFIGSIDLDLLGVVLAQGKYNLTLKVFPRLEGQLMNESQFPELLSTRTLILKRR